MHKARSSGISAVGYVLARSSKRYLPLNKERAVLCTALFFLWVNLLTTTLLTGCHSTLKDHLTNLASNSELNQPILLVTDSFTLIGWGKNKKTPHINIYIEGDGQSWQDPWTISNDPTPPDPVGFKLALADTRTGSVLYLARPCQYVMDKYCTPLDWTSHRFSQKVLNAYHQALQQLKETWKAKTFTLHAYSGGATVALLVAAQRQDVQSVITFAPLLDPVQWVNYHHYSPLEGSLSPLGQAFRLRHVPQEHFIGLADEEIPLALSKAYFTEIPESPNNLIHKIPQYTHHSDWPHLWKSYIVKIKQTLSP